SRLRSAAAIARGASATATSIVLQHPPNTGCAETAALPIPTSTTAVIDNTNDTDRRIPLLPRYAPARERRCASGVLSCSHDPSPPYTSVSAPVRRRLTHPAGRRRQSS